MCEWEGLDYRRGLQPADAREQDRERERQRLLDTELELAREMARQAERDREKADRWAAGRGGRRKKNRCA